MQNFTDGTTGWTDGGAPPQPGSKKPFSRLGFAYAMVIGLQQLLTLGINLLVTRLAPGWLQSGWYMWLLSYGPLYLVCFPLLLLCIRRLPDASPPRPAPRGSGRLSAGRMGLLLLCSLGIVWVLNALSVGLAALVELLKGGQVSNPLEVMLQGSAPLANLLFVSLVAPVMEEIMFRRLPYKKLAPYGDKAYILFSALLFALFHVNLYQVFYAFVLGMLLAVVYLHTGNLAYPILLHLLINLAGSGIPILLMGYAGTAAQQVWNVAALLLSMAGIVLTGVWLWPQRRNLLLRPATLALKKRGMLLNAGMLVYMGLVLALMALVLAA